MPVQITAEIRAVLPVIKGYGRIVTELIFGPDTDDISRNAERMNLISVAVCIDERYIFVPDRPQIPRLKAEAVTDLLFTLNEKGSADMGNDITLQDISFRPDKITDYLPYGFTRKLICRFGFSQYPL